MIITSLKGGLGNQLFQYAAGRALALRIGHAKNAPVTLKLDTTGYGENNGIDTMRYYALLPFNIEAEIATGEEIRALKYPFGIVSKGWRFFRTKVLRQFNINFRYSIYSHKDPFYLDGFFQTEKYFKDQEMEIHSDLTLRAPLSISATTILNEIKGHSKSVSLHVRRGDYVTDVKTNLVHGTCGPEYYRKAIELITQKIGTDVLIFVFSDDIEWVKNNLPLQHPAIYVSNPKIADYEELRLMSLCSHNIIANSSFSWWGAWLNTNPDKVVIAPKRWVAKNERRFMDIIPPTWIRI